MTAECLVERCVWADLDPGQLVYAVIVAALLECLECEAEQ